MQDKEEFVDEALRKKAVGYDTQEIVEEYQEAEGEFRLVKRKITTKFVPPDVSAIKEIKQSHVLKRAEDLTDEELAEEKSRLLELLAKQVGKEAQSKIDSCKKSNSKQGATQKRRQRNGNNKD